MDPVTWVVLIWLSCIRAFDHVFTAYGAGLLTSLLLMLGLRPEHGVAGALAAYAAGQAVTLVLLVRVVVQGTEDACGREASILACPLRYPQLVLVGRHEWLRRRLGANGRKQVLDHHTWTAGVQRVLAVAGLEAAA